MYKAIIVDDEAKARRLMEVLILENCAEIEIVGFAENVPDAAKLIHKKHIIFKKIKKYITNNLSKTFNKQKNNTICLMIFFSMFFLF